MRVKLINNTQRPAAVSGGTFRAARFRTLAS
jgi:hypothetical protein